MPTVAEQLRQAREARNLTVQQVADITKMRTDHLRALEEGNYNVFSAPVYIRGFVRTYAALVKLDVPQVMAALEAELGATQKFAEPPPLGEHRDGAVDYIMLQFSQVDWRKSLLGLGAVAVLVAGFWAASAWRHSKAADPLKSLKPGVYQSHAEQRGRDVAAADAGAAALSGRVYFSQSVLAAQASRTARFTYPAASTSSIVTPQPPGKDWLCRTGQGLRTSKKRKAANTPSVSGHVRAEKKCADGGRAPFFQARMAIQPRKQRGSAVISSSTIEGGSFCRRTVSPTPHSQTEKARPASAPAAKSQRLPASSKSANHPTPTTEPNVPGATGIRPTPKPWASQSLTNPASRWRGSARGRARRR